MELTSLSLLVLLNCLQSDSARVALTVVPNRSQFFKFESFSVSCEEEEESGWRVMKRTQDGEVHPCPSSCSIQAAFPATDSGAYWCETGLGETSNMVNITVTAGPVILEAPVLPVTEGNDVTLTCRQGSSTSSSNFTACFYKDGIPVAVSSTGNMSLGSVSTPDKGSYRCKMLEGGESPSTWLTVAAAPPDGQDPSAPLLSVSMLLRLLVGGTPYLLSTILLVLIYRERARVKHSLARQISSDVIMEMAS